VIYLLDTSVVIAVLKNQPVNMGCAGFFIGIAFSYWSYVSGSLPNSRRGFQAPPILCLAIVDRKKCAKARAKYGPDRGRNLGLTLPFATGMALTRQEAN
jgi:hypothetical protein